MLKPGCLFRFVIYTIFLTGVLIFVWNSYGSNIENYLKERVIRIVFSSEINSISNLKFDNEIDFISKKVDEFIEINKNKSFSEFYDLSNKFLKFIENSNHDKKFSEIELNELEKFFKK